MKKRLILSLLIVILFFLNFVVASEIIKDNYKKPLVEELIVKSDTLLNERYNGKFNVYYEGGSNIPKRISGEGMRLKERKIKTFSNENKNIELLTRGFLIENNDVLKINEKDLIKNKEEVDLGLPKQREIDYIYYTQEYKKISIFNSYVNFIIINDSITSLKINYFPDININTKSKLSDKEAIEVIKKRLNISNPYFNIENISLVIFPIESVDNYKYLLAWKVSLPLIKKDGFHSWIFFIDTDTGEVIYKIDRVRESGVSGVASGEIYEQHPLILKKEKPFKNQYVYIANLSNKYYFSGKGNNLNNFMITKNKISFAGRNNIEMKFMTSYDLETNYDYAFLEISTDNGSSWDILEYYNGKNDSWINKTVNLSVYSETNVLLKFSYKTDSSVVSKGFSLDDIRIIADGNLIFYDNADINSDLWNLEGFYKLGNIYNILNLTITNEEGYFNFLSFGNDTIIKSELKGPYIDVDNEDKEDSKFIFSDPPIPANLNWSWKDYDDSYKDEESNVFYHVNIVHDYFTKGGPFNITSMNYQMKATVEYFNDSCNAFSDGFDIYFFGAGELCESTALSSSVIYHEYTHSVIDHMYTYPLSSSMHEAFADYFASTITNNPLVGEGIWSEPIRNLKNNNRWPDDIIGESHYDSLILSGALWDLRFDLGKDYVDSLVIRAMKSEGNTYNEFLEDLLIIDDNNGYLWDGTPNILSICHAFLDNHGIYSPYCLDHTQYPFVNIDNPKEKERLYGNIIQINGTIMPSADGWIKNYKLEFFNGTEWNLIKESYVWQIINEFIGFWDITNIPKGEYLLRLSVVDNYDNLYIDEKEVYRDIPNINEASIICDTSPCIASSSMIMSRDNITNISEPNSPNTFTYCRDGGLGEYMIDESIENITIYDLNNTKFLVGDTIKFDIWVYCWEFPYVDFLRIKYTSDTITPNWNLKYLDYCNSSGFFNFLGEFELDNRAGYHAIRGIFSYFIDDINDDCDEWGFSDNDDVILHVKDLSPPTVFLINPENDSKISNEIINFEYIPQDNVDLNSCELKIYETNSITSMVYNISIYNITNGLKTNLSLKDLDYGKYEWFVECLDNSNNIGMSEKNIFTIDYKNMILYSPSNEVYNSKKVLFNISLKENVDMLEYINWNDKRPIWRRLCRDCNEYGFSKKRINTLKEGENNISIRATNIIGGDEKNISLFIDSKEPKITETESGKRFSDGNFYVEIRENNPQNLTLYYGNSVKSKKLNIHDYCTKNREMYKCSIWVDLSDFNNKKIEYWFVLEDVAGNKDESSKNKIDVDISPPILTNPDSFWKQGTERYSKYIYFNFIINESNFDEITYIDSFDKKQKEKRLCSKLKNGKCETKETFSKGVHNLTIYIKDKAGNSIIRYVNLSL